MRRSDRGFTLLELATVIVIIAILAAMLFPAFGSLRRRAQKAQCIGNLRSLFVATNAYIQQKGSWPQIDATQIKTRDYDKAWIAALEPFQVSRASWICPSIQEGMLNPDISKPENARIDYIGTPFDANLATPHKWSTQPWFIERGAMHGGGNLMIFSNGSIKHLYEYRRAQIP